MGDFNVNKGFNFRELFETKPKEERFVVPEEDSSKGVTSGKPFEVEVVTNGDSQEKEDQDSSEKKKSSNEFNTSLELTERSEPKEVKDDFDYSTLLGTILTMPIKLNDYQLPNEPIITITGNKKIVRTALTGVSRAGVPQRRGTIKELINVDDYQIKISGYLVNEKDGGSNIYPEEYVKKIKEIYELRRSVSIQCKLTDLFDIREVAIYKVTFPGEPGKLNSQRYEILAYSDEDFITDQVSTSS